MLQTQIAKHRPTLSNRVNTNTSYYRVQPLTFILIILQLIQFVQISSGQSQQVTLKNQTIYDGVTKDRYVTYANLNGSQGLQMTLPNQKLNIALDYTVMMWFKPKVLESSKIMYAFKFQSGFSCYFTSSQDIICENQEKCSKLQVDSSGLILNQWSHLTVSGTTFSDQAYLLLENHQNVISIDQKSYIVFKQYNTNWYVCIGFCDNDFYFTGGIRDFIYISNYLTQDQVSRVKNNYLMWDQSIMAYFRFNENNFNKDEFRSSYAKLINGVEGQMKVVDYISNDICYSIQDYDYLMHFTTDYPIMSYVFGAEFDDKPVGYEYAMSIWLYVEQDSCYAKNVSAGRDKCNIIHFDGVFTLYLSSNNSARFIFEAKQDYDQLYSQDIFIPQQQWINIQMSMSQFIGFEVRAYDILGRLVFIQNSTQSLQQQQSNSTLILFRNFRGYARYFQLYQKKQVLPIVESPQYIVGAGCLVYVHFTPANLINNQLYNWARTKVYPRNLNMTFNPYFDYIDWPAGDFEFNSGQTAGLTSSTTNLFDGIACNDQFRTLQLNSVNSRLHTTTPQFSYPIKSATVEFWFRAGNNVNQTQYLFQMWAYSTQHEYLSIHTDANNYLFCAPFGIDTYRSPYVTYYDYTENNRIKYGWFHIVCSFSFVKSLVGYIYREDLLGTYSASLSGIPNYLPADRFDIYIGNSNTNYQTGTGQLQLKELRLWASARSYSDIQKWRFNQINPLTIANNSLIVYLRMTESSYDEYNFASVANSSISAGVDFADISYVSNQDMLICPQSTYYLGSSCYLNPVLQFIATAFPYYNQSNSQLNWIFSFEQSSLINQNLLSELLVQWMIDDSLATNMTYSQRKNSKMIVPSTVFIDNFVYPIYLNVTNFDVTFGEIQEFMFVPSSCRFFIVEGNDSYSTFNNYTSPQGLQDIQFNMVLYTPSSNCANQPYYDQFVPNISYQISPQTNSTPNIQLVYNVQSSSSISISVKIPAQEQSKFTTGVKYQLIFSFYWTSSKYSAQINPYQFKFQDVLYSLQFQLSPVTVVVKLTSNYPYALKGDTLTLDASQTYITSVPQAQNKQNLTFIWICPTSLNAICDGVITSSMNITFNQFLNIGGIFNNSYSFMVQVVWQDSLGTVTFYFGQLSLSWFNIVSPTFQLTYPSPILYSAQSQTFLITFNYFTPKNISTLDISWQFTPNLTLASYYNYTLNKTRLTVAQGGFVANTDYSLTVYVASTLYQIANRAQTIKFSTKSPPFGGIATLNPSFGYMYITQFQITLQGWQSANLPITYEVWSTDTPYGSNPQYLLTDGWISVSTTFSFYTNSTNPFLVYIRDASMEQTVYAVQAMIGMMSNTSLSSLVSSSSIVQSSQLSLVKAMNGEQSNMERKYQYMLQLAKNLVQQENKTNTDVSIEAITNNQSIIYRELIINTIIKDIPAIQSNTNDEGSTIIKYSLTSLEQILNNTNFVNEDMMSNSLKILNDISSNSSSLLQKSIIQDNVIVKDFANSLSHILSFTKQHAKSRRNLYSLNLLSITNQAVEQVQALMKQVCASMNDQEEIIKVETINFQMILQTFSSDSNQQSCTIENGNSSVKVQVQNLLQSLKELNELDNHNICIQTVFYKINPLTFETQDSIVKKQSQNIMQFNISQSGNPSAEMQSMINMNINYYSKIEFQINPEEYSNNQSICMVYKNTIQAWSNNSCLTIINDDQTSIQCICNILQQEKYYGVFKDSSRKQSAMILSSKEVTIYQSSSYLSVVVFLLVFGIAGTSISIKYDKMERDYCDDKYIDLDLDGENHKDVNQNSYVSILKKLASITNKPIQYWAYKQSQINSYMILPSKSLFFQLIMEVHPVFCLLTKFDMMNPRIIRYSFYQLQLSLYCSGCLIFFITRKHSNENQSITINDLSSILYIGIIGSMVLISPVSFIQRFFKSQGKIIDGNQNNTASKASNIEKAPDITLNRSEYNSSQRFNSITLAPLQNDSASIQIRDSGQIVYSSEQTEGDLIINNLHHKYTDHQSLQTEHHDDLLKQKNNKAKVFTIGLFLQIRRLLLIMISYMSMLGVIVVTVIYSRQLSTIHQYCFIGSFFIGFIGNLVITQIMMLALNACLIQKLQKNKKFKCLLKLFINHECLTIAHEMQLVRKAEKLAQQDETKIRIKNHQMSLIMQSSGKNFRIVSHENVAKSFGIQEIMEENDLYEDSEEEEETDKYEQKMNIKDLTCQMDDDNDLDTTENNKGIEKIPDSDEKYMFSPSANKMDIKIKVKSTNTSILERNCYEQSNEEQDEDNINTGRHLNTSRQLCESNKDN